MNVILHECGKNAQELKAMSAVDRETVFTAAFERMIRKASDKLPASRLDRRRSADLTWLSVNDLLVDSKAYPEISGK